MKSEGYGLMAGGGFGGDRPPGPSRTMLSQRRPAPESPTRMRPLSPEQQAEVDARTIVTRERTAKRRKSRKSRAGSPQGFQALSAAQVNMIVDLYEAGQTAKAVAEEVKCSRTTVLKYLKDAGVDIRGARIHADKAADVVRLYATGIGIRQVAEELGMSNTTVRTRLIEAGVRVRTQGEWRKLQKERKGI